MQLATCSRLKGEKPPEPPESRARSWRGGARGGHTGDRRTAMQGARLIRIQCHQPARDSSPYHEADRLHLAAAGWTSQQRGRRPHAQSYCGGQRRATWNTVSNGHGTCFKYCTIGTSCGLLVTVELMPPPPRITRVDTLTSPLGGVALTGDLAAGGLATAAELTVHATHPPPSASCSL